MHIEQASMHGCIIDISMPEGIDIDFIMSAVFVSTAHPVFSRPRGVPAGHLQRGPVPDTKYGRVHLGVGRRFPSSPHGPAPAPSPRARAPRRPSPSPSTSAGCEHFGRLLVNEGPAEVLLAC